jgi:hypothetical protein
MARKPRPAACPSDLEGPLEADLAMPSPVIEPQAPPGPAEADPDSQRAARQELADLHAAIARARCIHCGIVGAFDIASTHGRIRYLRCRICQQHGTQVAV